MPGAVANQRRHVVLVGEQRAGDHPAQVAGGAGDRDLAGNRRHAGFTSLFGDWMHPVVGFLRKGMKRIGDVQPAGKETIRGDTVAWREAWPKVWVKLRRAASSA